jgi:cation:H+ antiporter
MTPITWFTFIAGFGLLVIGAELLVRGAARLACSLGVSPLVIGLTVVSLGTSSPELAVAFQSAVLGGGDIAIGNIVGSNILNVLLILGTSAMIMPLIVRQQLVRLEVPLLIIISVLLFFFSLDGKLGLLDGVLFVSGLFFYTIFAIWQSRRESRYVQDEYDKEYGSQECRNLWDVIGQIVFVISGFTLLVLGSGWLVDGAKTLALALGLSELIVGLTVVAVGTGMPEVVTSITASVRGEGDIAVGNVVGSNLYNILAVLGFISILAPEGVNVPPSLLAFDIPIMIAVAVACLPIFFLDFRISRWEGGLFFGYYIAYTLYLILDATGHDVLSTFSFVMLAFVIPITVITLFVLVVRYLRTTYNT